MREMKDSGIEWIGEIPEDWKINSMFQLFTQVKNKNYTLSETNLLSLSYGKIKRKNINTTDGLLPQSFDTYNIVQKNDIVLRLTDLQNDHKSLRVGISNEQGIITSAYVTLRNRTNNLSQYLYYYLHSFDVAKGFYGMGSGVRQGLTWDDLKLFKFVIPSQKEQQKISAFLDRKCTEIDSVISKTKATIEEYKKLKQSVITQAVTKGIIPNRPMKDSGIEWIGEIPNNYYSRKLKTFADIISKGTTPKDMFTEINNTYSIRYLKSENIVNNELSEKPVFSITEEVNVGELKRSKLSVKDILFVIAGASIGKVAIMQKKLLPANTNQATSFIRIKEKYLYCQRYIWYVLQSDLIDTYISLYAVQSAQPNLSMEDLGNIYIPFVNEKKEIEQVIEYLDIKCSEIDKLIAKKEQLLTEMENYKKAVIYEYVTGKKEVE